MSDSLPLCLFLRLRTPLLLGIAAALPQMVEAQGAVVIYGILDAFAGRVEGSVRSTRLDEGAHTVSRLGFRGREDLGGGLDAHFTLEMGLNVDNGSIPLGGGFGRQSFVGVGSRNWGAVDAGLQYSPMFFNLLETATFGMNTNWAPVQVVTRTTSQGAAMTALPPALRQANMVRYRYGVGRGAEGLRLDVAHAPGEGSTTQGSFTGMSAAWQAGNWFAGLSTQRNRTPSGAITAGHTYAHALSAYRKWDAFKFNFNYVVTGSSLAGSSEARHLVGGAEYSSGPHTFLAEVARRDVRSSPNDSVVSAIGYDYDLSKRTTLYGRLLSVNNKAAAAVFMATATVNAGSGADVRGIAIGVKHNF